MIVRRSLISHGFVCPAVPIPNERHGSICDRDVEYLDRATPGEATMNHRMPCRVLVVLIASLGGCGGAHSSTSISASGRSVTINANAGEPAPAAQTIHVTYQGDQVGVGYAPGVGQATWRALSVVGQTGSTMDVSLQASDTAIAGTRIPSLR